MSDVTSVAFSRSMWPARHVLRFAPDWLCLAATPTFAMMALLTVVLGRGAPDVLCAAATASPLGGMVPMYLLMSAFHAAPWLRLVSGRRSCPRRMTTDRGPDSPR
jgi:hypothetical protein